MKLDPQKVSSPHVYDYFYAILYAIEHNDISIQKTPTETTYRVNMVGDVPVEFEHIPEYNIRTLTINGRRFSRILLRKDTKFDSELDMLANLVCDAFLERVQQIAQEQEKRKTLSSIIDKQTLEYILDAIKQGKAEIGTNMSGVVGVVTLKDGTKISCLKYFDYDIKDICINDKTVVTLRPGCEQYDKESISIANKICAAVMDAYEILHQKHIEEERAKRNTPEHATRFKQQQQDFMRKLREFIKADNQKKK